MAETSRFIGIYALYNFAEYQRVAAVLRRRYPQRNADPVLALLLSEGILVQDLILPEPVSRDPDDDIFLACALSSEAAIVVSGGGDLLEVDGYGGIAVLKPREFSERHLSP